VDKVAAEATLLNQTIEQIVPTPVSTPDPGRPGLGEVSDNLVALELKGGPADETAFHDFHVLQLAFKHVWAQAMDASIYADVVRLYEETTALYEDAGRPAPVFGALNDRKELEAFLGSLNGHYTQHKGDPQPCPQDIAAAFPDVVAVWDDVRLDDKAKLQAWADTVSFSTSDGAFRDAKYAALSLIQETKARLGRLATLQINLNKRLSEPYAFDVFAKDTYNFGIMLTYRQKWEPRGYQAGDLAATIALAPGETRKYSKRQVIKKSLAVKEMERSMRSRADQATETGRAEAEIMKKASSSTNFKMTSSGSLNLGIGSISASSEFAANQGGESASVKKQFHESTVKSAQEYRLERSLEVDTSESFENESVSSGEISNPNNELTVTYLFYELQRRYQVSEQIHRARAVILVARAVPAPHEIDEAWLIANQWILSRVLLDDLFRPALEYLASGFAGDEIATDVRRSNFQVQHRLVERLEGDVAAQMTMRDALRASLVDTGLKMSLAEASEMPTIAKVFTLGLAPDPGAIAADRYAAEIEAGKARLEYVEQALADGQAKLKSASDAMAQASREYATALQQKTSRHIAIDRLRVHVKENILYYMQAIWDHEPPDQRFFEHYNLKIRDPKVTAATAYSAAPASGLSFGAWSRANVKTTPVDLALTQPDFTLGGEVELAEIADLDNPIGYKGNYIIYPMKKASDLTNFMLLEFVDEYLGIRDPDPEAQSLAELEAETVGILSNPNVTAAAKLAAEKSFLLKLGEARPSSDEVIVPSGQLFIEALPGRHPLLEDFKLRHRQEDLRKVRAEVRHAELENLRLAARLVAGERDDPEIERRILVDRGAPLVTDT